MLVTGILTSSEEEENGERTILGFETLEKRSQGDDVDESVEET